MGSTAPSFAQSVSHDREVSVALRWRRWPLVDHVRWSWLVIAGIVSVAGMVYYLGESLLLAVGAALGLTATLWQFFVPIHYEIGALGLRCTFLGRTRLVPWHAVRAYQLRTTGAVLYQRPDPAKIDLLRSLFVPYPTDADELLCALRHHLSHAIELPQ